MSGDILDLVEIIAEYCMAILEILGIGIIMLYALYATINNLYLLFIYKTRRELFQKYRLQLAHGILLGLEFLVAADIIKTVAIELSLASVGSLGIIVLIRTFLSFAIEIEITGKLPWRRQMPDT
jgi:uncharacterized membrane protein